MASKAILVLVPSTAEDQVEKNFVSKCLKCLELSARDVDTFAIVNSKAEPTRSVFCSWKGITSERNKELTVLDSDSSCCEEEDAFLSALNDCQKRLTVQRSQSGPAHLLNAAHVIHQLMDAFPMANTVLAAVDLVWVVPSSQAVDTSCAIELYGSLLRVSEWYSGRIDILCQDSTAKSVMDEWGNDLRARVITGCEVRCSRGVVWRGALELQEQSEMWDEKQSPQSLSLEGLSLVAGRDLFSEEVTAQLKELQGQDLVASHLEALQVLEPSSLPLMWISGAKFTLQVNDEAWCSDAAGLLREVVSWRGRCGLLLALKVTSLSSLKEQRGQRKWIKFVKKLNEKTALLGGMWQQLCGELESEPGLLFYAVCPEDSPAHLQQDPTHLQQGPSLDLWLLRSPGLMQCSALDGLVSDVPLVESVDGAGAKSIYLSLSSIPNLTAGELTQENSLSKADMDSRVFSPFWSLLSGWQQDPAWSPSACAEILAMKNKERIDGHKLKRLKTPDITFNNKVIPRPCTATDSESLTASDILQCFNPDGTPLEPAQLSPIPAMSNMDKLCLWTFPEEGEGKLAAMCPLGAQGFYHGVNYCLGAGEAEDARLVRIQQRCILDDTGGACTAVNTPRLKEVAKKRSSLRAAAAAAAAAKQRRDEEEEEEEEEDGAPNGTSARRKQQRKKVVKGLSTSTQPSQTPPVAKYKRRPLTDENSEQPFSISDSCPPKLAPIRKRGAIPLAENNWSSPPNTRPRVLHDVETVPGEGRGQAYPQKPLQSANRQAVKKKKPAAVKAKTVPDCQKGSGPGITETEEMQRSAVKDEMSLTWESSMQTPLDLGSAVDSSQTVAMKRSERHRKKLECIAVKALLQHGLSRDHPCFKRCFRRLYQISKSFLKDLKTTVNLSDEMRQVTQQNAKQVIGFELKMAGAELDKQDRTI